MMSDDSRGLGNGSWEERRNGGKEEGPRQDQPDLQPARHPSFPIGLVCPTPYGARKQTSKCMDPIYYYYDEVYDGDLPNDSAKPANLRQLVAQSDRPSRPPGSLG